MTTCSAEEKYVSEGAGKAGHLLWAMEVLRWSTLRFPCVGDDLPRTGGRTLLGLWLDELRFRNIGKRNSAARWRAGHSRCMVSLLIRTVRVGVRHLAREDQTLVLDTSFLTADNDEAAAEGSSGISDSSFFTVPFLTQVPFWQASARSSTMASSNVLMT